MMDVAREKPEAQNIAFVVSDVKALEFPDNSLDLVTIAFATRNINVNRDALIQTFAEFRRVLKPGGRFINLETSQPSSRLIRWLFHAYVKLFVKVVGGLISGSYSGYAYLRHTIPRFYPPEELRDIMCRAGFTNVTYRTMMFGVAAIHQGIKG
jgi:demethylmenaquinone methyltransferase/2-methoxy-6-polyprenyl-1,4-benzoquinol methylase